MTAKPLEIDVILKRINGIQGELFELGKLASLPFKEFEDGVGFKLAQYHLHRALEGVFNISAHIISRLPGAHATQYKELAQKLGEYGIIDKTFANTNLVEMAKYRNRLVHFYAEVAPQEIYDVIHKDLGDFDTFLAAVKRVIEKPEHFDLARS